MLVSGIRWVDSLYRGFYGVIFVIWLSVIAPINNAQTTFKHFTTTNGLSHNTVMDLLQDYCGFLWFATADGLNQLDSSGVRFGLN